jgi:hypothetical protein
MDEYARLTTFCSSSPLMPLCTGFDCMSRRDYGNSDS